MRKPVSTLLVSSLVFLAGITLAVAAPFEPGKTQQLTSPDQVPNGLAKTDWHSIRAAYEAGRHAFQPTATGWQARNPGQQWLTRFDGRGFIAEPADGGWQWGLELQSYGFPGAERTIAGTPTVQAAGQRLTYQWDAAVTEWWVNDARGLEHGFTVNERPATAPSLNTHLSALNSGVSAPDPAAAPLNFRLAVRGGLRPAITPDALGVQFLDAHGANVLNYGGLKVWDADGKILPSHFAPANTPNVVLLLVDERGARYPLTIDPIAQQAYLKADNSGANDNFGASVSVSGDTVVVGATGENSNSTGVNGIQNNFLGTPARSTSSSAAE